MRNYFLPSAILALFFLAPSNRSFAAVSTQVHLIYFQTDSFSLSSDAQQELSDLAKQLSATGEVEICISGHTDSEGNSAYNQNLSKQRAASTARALISAGIAPESIHQNYFGERRPVSENSNEPGRAKNRRVEITVKHTIINSISDMFTGDSALAPQQFDLNTSVGQTIKGLKGMEISIPADAFTGSSGEAVRPSSVMVTLTEFPNITDAFFQGITTMSDQGLLQSGGMFYISASANGQALQLKPGKALEVKIPAADPENGMKVYLSKTDSCGNIVWTESSSAFQPVTRPVDVRTITLTDEKYSSFLSTPVPMPSMENIPGVHSFIMRSPEKPVPPRLVVQKERDLKTSGFKRITRNKKIQQKMLEHMNHVIEVSNQKRRNVYEKKLAAYLADSAAYPEKTRSYNKAKLDYTDYALEKRAELDSVMTEYKEAVIKKRLHYYLRAIVQASDSGRLFNADLVQRVKNFCCQGSRSFRDYAFEKKLEENYCKLKFPPERNVCFPGILIWAPDLNESGTFENVLADPEVKSVMNQLVDDNPYLTAEQREMQKTGLGKGLVISSYTKPELNNYYAATIGQLGYVNCDRLYKEDNVVALDLDQVNQNAQSMAFIKGVNASQNIYPGKNNFKKNEDLMLLSVYFENGRPVVAYRELKLNSPQKLNLEYREMKLEEFKQLVLSFI